MVRKRSVHRGRERYKKARGQEQAQGPWRKIPRVPEYVNSYMCNCTCTDCDCIRICIDGFANDVDVSCFLLLLSTRVTIQHGEMAEMGEVIWFFGFFFFGIRS